MSPEPLTHWSGEPLSTWAAAWGVPTVEAYERIGSTNDRAGELAAEPGAGFSVVIADWQTEGRGRRGASWHSPSGTGLWMSVVLPGAGPGLHLPLLVGLAVAEAIEELPTPLQVGIEWPNDLVVHGLKLGGILCESAAGAVVAGVGINLRTPEGGFPGPLDSRATSLEDHGVKMLSHSRLAGLIVGGLKRRVIEPTPVIDAEALEGLRARDALAARYVMTEQHGQGTARGIEPDGALLLERGDGSRVRVVAGSVRPA